MKNKWIEYFDEPEEQIVLCIGFLAGWKKLKPQNLPESIKGMCKKLYNRYLVGFYIARAIQTVSIFVVAKVGGLF